MNKTKLSYHKRPDEIRKYGEKSSKVLKAIVDQNHWCVDINGKKYLQFEAWQTLGRFFGYTVRTARSEYVKYGNVEGFEAFAEVIDKEGNVVGSAEAACMRDEKNWINRDLHALKSMAQTRAASKSLRQVLSWVAVLSGFEATPSDEMDGVGKNQLIKNSSVNLLGEKATLKQLKMIFALTRSLGEDPIKVNAWISDHYKVKDNTQLTKRQASEVIDSLQWKIKQRPIDKNKAKYKEVVDARDVPL